MLIQSVKEYLDASGVSSVSWPIYLGFLPDDSSQCIALFESGGYPPDTMERDNETVTFQLRVRSEKGEYMAGRNKWKEIFDLLEDAEEVAGSPVLLEGFTLIQAMHFGPLQFNDAKLRPNFTSNFRVVKDCDL